MTAAGRGSSDGFQARASISKHQAASWFGPRILQIMPLKISVALWLTPISTPGNRRVGQFGMHTDETEISTDFRAGFGFEWARMLLFLIPSPTLVTTVASVHFKKFYAFIGMAPFLYSR